MNTVGYYEAEPTSPTGFVRATTDDLPAVRVSSTLRVILRELTHRVVLRAFGVPQNSSIRITDVPVTMCIVFRTV